MHQRGTMYIVQVAKLLIAHSANVNVIDNGVFSNSTQHGTMTVHGDNSRVYSRFFFNAFKKKAKQNPSSTDYESCEFVNKNG